MATTQKKKLKLNSVKKIKDNLKKDKKSRRKNKKKVGNIILITLISIGILIATVMISLGFILFSQRQNLPKKIYILKKLPLSLGIMGKKLLVSVVKTELLKTMKIILKF